MTTQLRALLDAAADAQPPLGVAARAVGEASRRRRNRAVVSGAMLLAAAVAVAGFAVLRPGHTGAVTKPVDVATIPLELPGPDGLPTLAEAPMDAAGAAYVVDGRLVLVSAKDGHAAVGRAGDTVSLGDVRSVTLSPDGRFAVLQRGWPHGVDAVGQPLTLVDVAQARETRLHGANLVDARPVDGLQPQLVTWSPDSRWFACACTTASGARQVRLVQRADAQDGTVDGSAGWDGGVSGLSWGTNGLALRDPGAHGVWRLASNGWLPGGHGGTPRWLVLGPAPVAVMAGADNRHFLSGGGSRYVVWSGYGGPERGSLGADRMVMVGDAVQGFLIGTRPATSAAPGLEAPVRVRWVSYFMEPRDLTQLPPGTSSASFAAALVGDPTAAPTP